MHILLTLDEEAQLSRIAALEDRPAEELARDMFSRGLADEVRFIAAVRRGREQPSRGEFIEPDQVWAGMEQALRS